MKQLIFTPLWSVLVSIILMTSGPALAQDIHPFHINYEARYGNMGASAERMLEFDNATQQWQLTSVMRLQLLGATVTEINETSVFGWQDNTPIPLRYEFRQRGVGSRTRSLDFGADKQVQFTVNDQQGSLTLTEAAYDDLNSFLVLSQQLQQGATDITFNVVDRNELKPYRYQVVGEEMLNTAAGSFSTLHISRIRDAGNERTTDLWLATRHDYLLVKLVQEEPKGDTITLELKNGTVDGKPLQGD